MKFYVNAIKSGNTIITKYVYYFHYRPRYSEREYRLRNTDEYTLSYRLGINKTNKGWLKTTLAKGIFLRAMKDETEPSIRRLIKYRLIRNLEFKSLKAYNEKLI